MLRGAARMYKLGGAETPNWGFAPKDRGFPHFQKIVKINFAFKLRVLGFSGGFSSS